MEISYIAKMLILHPQEISIGRHTIIHTLHACNCYNQLFLRYFHSFANTSSIFLIFITIILVFYIITTNLFLQHLSYLFHSFGHHSHEHPIYIFDSSSQLLIYLHPFHNSRQLLTVHHVSYVTFIPAKSTKM